MIYLELSDEEIEYSTEFFYRDIEDIMHTFEEILRQYTDLDGDVDNYIIKGAKEIELKTCN